MIENKPFRIFVVEDDEWYNRLLVHHLSLNPDYDIESFTTGKECLDNLYKAPDVITLDYRLPDIKGLEVLKRIKDENEDIQVILISEQNEIEVVVDLLKYGAYDYIVKSRDIRERLLNTVQNIRNGERLKHEVISLRKEVKKKYKYTQTIIGSSPAITRIFGLIEKATRTGITVTVSGETGTGKELVAKAIHYNSNRADKPFVAVNVAAIPRDLIESELFGFEKGSFTGANYRRTGKFEEADKGTLFLDEIAEMDPALQAKVLRVLQEKEIVRIGSNDPVKTDCRIIVATNKNLQDLVIKKEFRQDLYYRLYGLHIELPPLRERGNDIILLAKFFINEFCRDNGIPPKSLAKSAVDKLMAYSFPGNIRELKSVMELAITITDGNEINGENIVLENQALMNEITDKDMTLKEYNLRILNKYLEKYDNNTTLVAEKLGIGVATVYRMMKKIK
ncbi:MAG: sigma-54 dependent transcriptional regulator [Prolixibacteraceae bacterium]|nr:sigma-54 dependent transcriptional regulator [Prolixibacteraceae bacterium]